MDAKEYLETGALFRSFNGYVQLVELQHDAGTDGAEFGLFEGFHGGGGGAGMDGSLAVGY